MYAKEIFAERVDVPFNGGLLEVKVSIPTNQKEVDELRTWFKSLFKIFSAKLTGMPT